MMNNIPPEACYAVLHIGTGPSRREEEQAISPLIVRAGDRFNLNDDMWIERLDEQVARNIQKSLDFTGRLKAEGIRISIDGRGRALDNIFVERLWRSVKYEEVYLHDYATVPEATQGLKKYFVFYNAERQHQSLDYQTPQEVYEGRETGGIR